MAEPLAGPGAGVGEAPGPPVAPLPLGRTAALVGGYRWVEHALFELLGSWVAEFPLAAVQVHLDAESERHAWHAALWAERLPVLDGTDPEALTVAPPAAAAAVALLAGAPGTAPAGEADGGEPADGPGALPRLAGLYRVLLPRLVVTYGRHLGAASPVTDAPVIRALQLVLADAVEDWRSGERLLQRLITRPHDVSAVHAFLRQLETAVVGQGVTSGLVAMPDGVPPG